MCILPHRWVRKHALCLRFGVRLRFGLRLRCFFVHRCGDRGCDNRGDERCSRREVCEPLVASGQGGPRRVARELRGSPRGTPEGTDGRTPSLASEAGEIAVSSPDPGYTLFRATPPRSPDLRGTDHSTDARAFRPRVVRRTRTPQSTLVAVLDNRLSDCPPKRPDVSFNPFEGIELPKAGSPPPRRRPERHAAGKTPWRANSRGPYRARTARALETARRGWDCERAHGHRPRGAQRLPIGRYNVGDRRGMRRREASRPRRDRRRVGMRSPAEALRPIDAFSSRLP